MSEGQIVLRPFHCQDLREVATILAGSFEDKFSALAPLPREKLIDFLIDSDLVQNEPFEGYMVDEFNQRCIGIMLLKWKNQKRIKRTNRLYRLVKKYGLSVTLKLLFGMEMLKKHVTGNECYIEHIAVSADARGMGVGSLLLEYGDKLAKTLPGNHILTLYVAKDNSRAFELYKRQGFIVDKEFNSYITAKIFGKKKWLYMVRKGSPGTDDQSMQ
ncbi:GNAT family N-acetyltransferase [Paenibacillus sp. MBLB4367]|uniref:GNAT family N-acetyltransferase n=1 Tax=Paenibacillus sp. MBLB4367 TaxID=3384767 RepID=UPI003908427F